MKMKNKNNRIYFNNDWGLFIGEFTDNNLHKHSATQLSISLSSKITLKDKNDSLNSFGSFVVKSNVPHQLDCETEHLLFLFHPTFSIGYHLQQISKEGIFKFQNLITKNLKAIGMDYLTDKIDFDRFVTVIKQQLNMLLCDCEDNNHFEDDKIIFAINYLQENFERNIPVEEVAQKCYLSQSRFLHRFKEKTGVTYRKAQQWHKVSQSFKQLMNQSITTTAHQYGFTDSAHFSKVFKETFGFNPKTVIKLS